VIKYLMVLIQVYINPAYSVSTPQCVTTIAGKIKKGIGISIQSCLLHKKITMTFIKKKGIHMSIFSFQNSSI